MVSDCTIKEVDKGTWLRLAPNFKDYNYRQSWSFGVACASRVGAVSEHVLIHHAEKGILGFADVRIKMLPFVGGGIAYINGGPLVVEKEHIDDKILEDVVTALQQEYVVKRNLTLRIAPAFSDDVRNKSIDSIFSTLGFNCLYQKRKTILLDLFFNLDEIRQNFHQKWRNVLNTVEKKNLALHSDQNIVLFEQFIPLFNDLITKKAFSVDLGIDFYANVQNQSADPEKFIVTIAEDMGNPIAGHVCSILGDTCVYLLGATNDAGRKLNAAYLLQWEVIKKAKALGCRWYDLGGIDPVNNPGVYRFKQRMGGMEITIPGPYEKKASGARAILVQTGEKLYSALKPYLERP
ncbi:MAG: peptidoglycan bridge formation glycyltransferase FemA/FemB family protein [Chlorobium sp.]|nr:peptidoglycan bridge formation glycyltransferase FemA/FemB family protein [Chlorobium sp.]